MPADLQTVRRLALALPAVEEGVCFGTPAFYVRRKLIVRMCPDDEMLMVRCPKESREELIDTYPDILSVTDHYRNYPAILISLLAIEGALLARMIENAWRMQAPKRLVTRFDAERGKAR